MWQNHAEMSCRLASHMLLYYSKCYDYIVGSRTSIFFIPHDYWVGFNSIIIKRA